MDSDYRLMPKQSFFYLQIYFTHLNMKNLEVDVGCMVRCGQGPSRNSPQSLPRRCILPQRTRTESVYAAGDPWCFP